MNQSELEVNTSKRRQARENACDWFWFLFLVGQEGGASFAA